MLAATRREGLKADAIGPKRHSVLAVAGVSPCEEKCPFPRVTGQRGSSRAF